MPATLRTIIYLQDPAIRMLVVTCLRGMRVDVVKSEDAIHEKLESSQGEELAVIVHPKECARLEQFISSYPGILWIATSNEVPDELPSGCTFMRKSVLEDPRTFADFYINTARARWPGITLAA